MPVPCVKVTLMGQTFGGGDTWNAGFQMVTSGVANQSDCEVLANAISGLWVTDVWDLSALSTVWPANVTYTACKVSLLDADGHVEAVGVYTLGSPNYGSGTGSVLPAECAICVSLLTEMSGPRGRGRMYLPNVCAAAVDTNGQITSSVQTALAAAMKTFFDGVNSLANFGVVGVASQAGGFLTPVNRIRLGNVVDSQRRRRNAVGENYVLQTLA